MTVRWLSRSLLTSAVNNVSDIPVVLQTSGFGCNMRAVDFDEDGDLDLLLGHSGITTTNFAGLPLFDPPRFQRYFERVSDDLEERIGEENPLEGFGGQVVQIADLDGDARLDVLAEDIPKQSTSLRHVRWAGCRYFRRTAAGSFVEPSENPLAEIMSNTTQMVQANLWFSFELHIADWNSDGLPDVLRLKVGDEILRLRVWKLGNHPWNAWTPPWKWEA